MKNIKTMLLSGLLLICPALIFNSCTKPRYCTFAMASNRCENFKDVTNLCFECTRGSCPDIENKSVWIGTRKDSTGKWVDSCCVKLGKKLSDCGKCEDKIVELLSLAPGCSAIP